MLDGQVAIEGGAPVITKAATPEVPHAKSIPKPVEAKKPIFKEADLPELKKGDTDHDMLKQIAEGDGKRENKTGSAFDKINKNIAELTERINKGEGNVDKAKQILGNLLKTREQFYLSVAQGINPDIKAVEGKQNVYQIGEAKIYGSVIAVLDATSSLESHKVLAERLKLKSPSAETTSVMGENLPPKKLIESAIVFSGSSAQDRIQPFSADMDMAEHVKIKAKTAEEAGQILAESISTNVNKQINITDSKGNKIALHFLEMKAGGNYPPDAATELQGQKLRWSVQEIKQGYLEYKKQDGQIARITLDQACQDPKMLKVDYVGVTDDTVVEVTKVSTVIAKDDNEKTLIDNSSGQADAYQEIYFDDPSEMGLLNETSDPEKYLSYVKAFNGEMKKYSQPGHENKLKVAKRMYNLLKVNGDLAISQELSGIFSSDAAAMYQLVDRLGMTQQAVKVGLNISPQREIMTQRLKDLIGKRSDSQSKNLLEILNNQGNSSNIEEMRKTVLNICNQEVTVFMENHPKINDKMKSIVNS